MSNDNVSPPEQSPSKQITADNFWQTDLVDIERSFLPEGKVVADLPVTPHIFI